MTYFEVVHGGNEILPAAFQKRWRAFFFSFYFLLETRSVYSLGGPAFKPTRGLKSWSFFGEMRVKLPDWRFARSIPQRHVSLNPQRQWGTSNCIVPWTILKSLYQSVWGAVVHFQRQVDFSLSDDWRWFAVSPYDYVLVHTQDSIIHMYIALAWGFNCGVSVFPPIGFLIKLPML